MSEGDSTDESQKTEEPTARRLEEARKRGQIVYSKEVSNWAVLFAATILIAAAGPGIMSELKDVLQVFLSQPHAMSTDGASLTRIVASLMLDVGAILFVPIALLIAAGILSGFVQTGPLFTFETIKPDLSKISPLKGFERLFSKRSIVEFVKGIAKLVIVSIAGVIALRPYFDNVEQYIMQEMPAALFDMRSLFIRLMIAVLSVLSVIAILDYLYQRFEFMQKMRMSKQEMKEEFKQTEGDPIVKAKLRQIREAKARQRMMQAIPTADVVITNPTHYAVALKYDAKEMNAPILVAKGADLIAENIKKIAKENKVPLIENAPLARALFDSMELEQVIPAEHFKAVAEVISYVFKLKGKKL
jgi:flagellar biosynthetic protein FlhB